MKPAIVIAFLIMAGCSSSRLTQVASSADPRGSILIHVSGNISKPGDYRIEKSGQLRDLLSAVFEKSASQKYPYVIIKRDSLTYVVDIKSSTPDWPLLEGDRIQFPWFF